MVRCTGIARSFLALFTGWAAGEGLGTSSRLELLYDVSCILIIFDKLLTQAPPTKSLGTRLIRTHPCSEATHAVDLGHMINLRLEFSVGFLSLLPQECVR